MSKLRLGVAASIGLSLGMFTSACRSNFEAECKEGTLSCPCLPDGGCDGELICQSNVCIEPIDGTSDDSSDSMADSSSESGENSSSGDGDGDGDGDAAGDGDGDGDGTQPLDCADGVLDPAYGVDLVEVNTLPQSDNFDGSCNTGAGGKDAAYDWVVPFDGWFEVHTRGSDFDSLVYLIADDCEGAEFACNNDGLGSGDDGSIIDYFNEGDRYLIVVDGNVGASGTAKLSVEVVDCPGQDLGGGESLPQEFSHLGGDDEHGGACGGEGQPERSYRFTAPDAGLWRFSTLSPGTPTESAIYLENGPACGGPQLACNGGGAGGFGSPSTVSRYLDAGQEITVIVDALASPGAFTFDAELLANECPIDTSADPGQGDVVIANIEDYPDTFTASCGDNAALEFAQHTPYPDYVFAFNDLEPGSAASCYLEVTANFPFTLSAMQGECTGAEFHCSTHDEQTSGGFNYPKNGGRVTVVVSPNLPSWQGSSGNDFTVSTFCAI